MKRTEKILKSKDIRVYAKKYRLPVKYLCRYNRNYVKSHFEDVTRLSFGKTSFRLPSNCRQNNKPKSPRLYNYLLNYLYVRVGQDCDKVFRDFQHLGWDIPCDIHSQWRSMVADSIGAKDPLLPECQSPFYVSADGLLATRLTPQMMERQTPKGNKKKYPMNEGRGSFTPKQLEHNTQHPATDFGDMKEVCLFLHTHPSPDEAKRRFPWLRFLNSRYGLLTLLHLGDYYIRYKHRVILCPIYHVFSPDNLLSQVVQSFFGEELTASVNLFLSFLTLADVQTTEGDYRTFPIKHYRVRPVLKFSMETHQYTNENQFTDMGMEDLTVVVVADADKIYRMKYGK